MRGSPPTRWRSRGEGEPWRGDPGASALPAPKGASELPDSVEPHERSGDETSSAGFLAKQAVEGVRNPEGGWCRGSGILRVIRAPEIVARCRGRNPRRGALTIALVGAVEEWL